MIEDEDEDEGDDEYQPSTRTVQRWVSSSQDHMVHLSVPKRELLKATGDASTRCKLSHRTSVALTASLVKAGGASLKDATISKSSSHRHRLAHVNSSYNNIVRDFKEHMPPHIVIHWDGKQISYAHQKKTDERLAVVGSFPGADRPAQFLGAPQVKNGSGSSIRDATKATLEEWCIQGPNIIGLSWDTTSANTGPAKGAATLLERDLGSARLWLASRQEW